MRFASINSVNRLDMPDAGLSSGNIKLKNTVCTINDSV